jgi:hypothetical protein
MFLVQEKCYPSEIFYEFFDQFETINNQCSSVSVLG